MTVLRWVFVLPAILLASTVAYFVFLFALHAILRPFLGVSSAANVAAVAASAVSGFAAVYSGSVVAPSHQRWTLNVIAVSCILFFGVFLLLFAATGRWLQVAERSALLLGVIAVVVLQRVLLSN